MIDNVPNREAPLDADERRFLETQYQKSVANLKGMARSFVIFSLILTAIITAIVQIQVIRLAKQFTPDNPAPSVVFVAVSLFLILCITTLSFVSVSYFRTVRKLKQDCMGGIKTVEPSQIIRKLYTPVNDTYHLFVSSTACLSVEVSSDEYNALSEGDRINLEYSPRALVSFGHSYDH